MEPTMFFQRVNGADASVLADSLLEQLSNEHITTAQVALVIAYFTITTFEIQTPEPVMRRGFYFTQRASEVLSALMMETFMISPDQLAQWELQHSMNIATRAGEGKPS